MQLVPRAEPGSHGVSVSGTLPSETRAGTAVALSVWTEDPQMQRHTPRLLAGVAAALLIAGCGGPESTRYQLTGESPALGADARIDVTSTPAGNRHVDIDVQWLPPPERYGTTGYTVWILPPDGPAIPAGRLEYDSGARRGRLSTVTPYSEFRIVIAAEPPGERFIAPGSPIILQRDVVT